MRSYAILGASGSTGSQILNLLLTHPREDAQISVLVRSKAKLQAQLGGAETKLPSNLTVYEGSLSDTALLAKCVARTRAVFVAVGPLGNQPGCTIAQDVARDLSTALQTLRDDEGTGRETDGALTTSLEEAATSQEKKRAVTTTSSSRRSGGANSLPRVVFLSSASTSDYLSRDLPRGIHSFLLTAAGHVYADVAAAERLLRAEQSWLSSVYVKPGGLVYDEPRGHLLSTERQQTFTSFSDLAAGMVEIADEDDEERWAQKDVSVVPRSGKTKFTWTAPVALGKGLVNYLFPWTYQYLH